MMVQRPEGSPPHAVKGMALQPETTAWPATQTIAYCEKCVVVAVTFVPLTAESASAYQAPPCTKAIASFLPLGGVAPSKSKASETGFEN